MRERVEELEAQSARTQIDQKKLAKLEKQVKAFQKGENRFNLYHKQLIYNFFLEYEAAASVAATVDEKVKM